MNADDNRLSNLLLGGTLTRKQSKLEDLDNSRQHIFDISLNHEEHGFQNPNFQDLSMNDFEMSSIGIISQRMSYMTTTGADDYQDLLVESRSPNNREDKSNNNVLTDSLDEGEEEEEEEEEEENDNKESVEHPSAEIKE